MKKKKKAHSSSDMVLMSSGHSLSNTKRHKLWCLKARITVAVADRWGTRRLSHIVGLVRRPKGSQV